MLAARQDRLPAALVTLVACVWVTVLVIDRFTNAFTSWGAALDMFHWCWAYERYHTAGAYPPGHLLTDLAFVYHAPPLWWLLMASLSHVVEPRTAAASFNVFVFFATGGAAFLLVRARAGYVAGVTAAVIVLHNRYWWSLAAGGFPRATGALFTLLIAWAWVTGRRRGVLLLLVLAAATYPSVVVPLGLAFGACSLVQLARSTTRDWRAFLELAVAGTLCLLLASTQSLLAPASWGGVVTYAEADALGAWARPGGRFPYVPFQPVYVHLANAFGLAFAPRGHKLWSALVDWSFWHGHFFNYVPFLLALVVAWRRGRRLPAPLLWIVAGALVGYTMARVFAFKLFVPSRQLNHVVPWLMACAMPLSWATLLDTFRLTRARRDGVLALVTLGTLGLLYGTGTEDADKSRMYVSFEANAPLFEAVRELPLDVNIAGPITLLDPLPLFTGRQVYMNRTMINPIRAGLFAAQARRVRAQYAAYYSSSLADVIEFSEQEGVTHILMHADTFKRVEGRIPKPLRADVVTAFEQHKAAGFALQTAAIASAVRYRDKKWILLEVAALPR